MKLNDRVTFTFLQPVVSRNQRVVFVRFPIAFLPVKKLAGRDTDPADNATGSNFCFFFPVPDVVDDFVANVVGNPLSV